MNWRGTNDIVPAGIVALIAIAAMAREYVVDVPGLAMGIAALAIGGLLLLVAVETDKNLG